MDLTVSDLKRSGHFYEAVLSFLGYHQGHNSETWIEWDMGAQHCASSVGIRLAKEKRPHNRYSCGLHHLAWVADSRADVDRMQELLVEIGATALDPPKDYPHYREGYYAVFFADPNGLKLEFVYTAEC
jgi:catechol 2,3-dioxygenase-like lactoylglutathione lyase family enzyme